MDIVMIIGRVLFALMFLAGGLNHFTKSNDMVGYAQFKKVPAAKAAVLLSGVVLVLGGLSVILGIYADLGSLALAVALLVMALKMHDFWAQTDPQAKQTETIAFFKNVSMAGAALFMFALVASGAGDEGFNFGPHLGD
ncbi:MAG: DoxX family protein, partial [Actinobacteria bacterium]|nr:DoxX family protein [Actinomycetota bacterium]